MRTFLLLTAAACSSTCSRRVRHVRQPQAHTARARARADDVKLHEHFLRSSLRTRNPDEASLFFVPVYLGRLFNWFWGCPHCDDPDAPPPPMCRREQVRGFVGLPCACGRAACS